MKIEELEARLVELNERSQAIIAQADGEKRDLTDDERKEIEEVTVAFDKCRGDIDKANRVQAQTEVLAKSQGRQSAAGELGRRPIDPLAEDFPGERAASASAGRPPRIPAQPRDAALNERWGWRSAGEFFQGVFAAGKRNITDPRLVMGAASTFGNEGAGTDGGFAVPPAFRAEIEKAINAEEGLLARTDMQTSSSNVLTIPVDESTPWGTSGVRVFRTGEGAAITPTKPALRNVNIEVPMLAALVPMTDNLLEDAPALQRWLTTKVPEAVISQINLEILQGTGAGQMLGMLNAPALITVAKETGQSAATVVWENIVNMWARLYGPSRADAIWLISQSVEPQLQQMAMPIGTGGVPVYLPAGGAADAPFARIFGRPVIPVEACNDLGTAGDIVLCSLRKYLSVQKSAGLRVDISPHFYFDQAITAFRFLLRLGGQPWLRAPITSRSGSFTYSHYVALATRA